MSTRRTGLFLMAGVVIGLVITGLATWTSLLRSSETPGGFVGEVRLGPLDRAAVYNRGRLKSFKSFASETVSTIAGPRGVRVEVDGELVFAPADFAYLDLMLRPERYEDAPLIHLGNKPMRQQLGAALLRDGVASEEEIRRFVDTGQIAEPLLFTPSAMQLFNQWSSDLIRTRKFVDRLEGAVNLRRPEALLSLLRVIPPPNHDPKTPWLNPGELFPVAPGQTPTPGQVLAMERMEPSLREEIARRWVAFAQAWRAGDATTANARLAEFTARVREVSPELYPSESRMFAESLYFRIGSLVWGWVIYLAAVLVLLMAVAWRWPGARALGIGLFSVAFVVQTAALLLRWYISGRWPNSNMFEAVTTSVWFGALLAIPMEYAARKTPLKNLFLIGAAVASMAALMSAQFIHRLDPSVNNMMPILHDLWLYIHTNVIIAAYALIAMAAVTAILYLLWRLFGGGPAHARLGGTEMLIEASSAASGRATTATGRRLASSKASLGEVFDGATLVMVELSFILLWAGIIMGAIWADHSWGRPWGWDPKEVFALNTFLVYLVLIHIRLKTRDKGLWTALLALIGCGVMLFNWIVINFVIAGLHSYA